MKTLIPPIKCQGIKSKLVGLIVDNLEWDGTGIWIEPFMGSGVVGFNVAPRRGLFCDTNPHIIDFYQAINDGSINPSTVRAHLNYEGEKLSALGADYYYAVRDRFNANRDPLDFLFLNRACFNGIIRFNRKGEFNVPFGHKPTRFSKAYITKIANQVGWVAARMAMNDWAFVCQDFRTTLCQATKNDFIYCDPPYAGRHTDYFNAWSGVSEIALNKCLISTEAKFILSTWHSNQHRKNTSLIDLWGDFNLIVREHFYHVGAREKNRKPILEALVTNFVSEEVHSSLQPECHQISLFSEESPKTAK